MMVSGGHKEEGSRMRGGEGAEQLQLADEAGTQRRFGLSGLGRIRSGRLSGLTGRQVVDRVSLAVLSVAVLGLVGLPLAQAEESCTGDDAYCEGLKAEMSCCERGSGLLLPVFPYEHTWSRGFRGTLYLIGLLWCFVGVSVLSDVFMAGIETITNSTYEKKTPKLDSEGKEERDEQGNIVYITESVLIWNPAVANLSLMALGSSTPEILLSIIEIGGQEFIAGKLGPGTVVGSASFNLYVITAMCMVALPDGEGRKIDGVQTFLITSFFSVVSYLWLYIIVLVISPDVVEIWEALVTLLMMPVLMWLVWMADNNWFKKDQVHPEEGGEAVGNGDKHEAVENGNGVDHAANGVTPVKPIDRQGSTTNKNQNYFKHRHNALSSFMGGKKAVPGAPEDEETRLAREEAAAEKMMPVFQFEAMQYSFLETVGDASIKILRQGKADVATSVRVSTVDGSAKSGKAYEGKDEVVKFAAGETEKDIAIPIIHDKVWNPDQEFFVVLSNVEEGRARLGKMFRTEVTIIDMDSPGIFCWVEQGPQNFLSSDSRALLVMERRKGCSGVVHVRVKTEEGTAKAGTHFTAIDEELVWKDNEAAKTLPITLQQFEKPESPDEMVVRFYVDLQKTGHEDGAEIGENQRAEVLITYNNPENIGDDLEEVAWADQFRQALSVSGGEDMEEAGALELFMHYISITWKLLAAFVPPAHYGGGWWCFWIALGMVGVVTALINDLASIFGCLVGLEDPVTAITIVALGTSLPDTFASVLSIRADDNADNAIGNVTGSNSINVFLGLGLPWSVAAIYWQGVGTNEKWHKTYEFTWDRYAEFKDKGAFVVQGGSLGFNTLLFSILTIIAFLMFFLRRKYIGYEIGGPKHSAQISSFCFFALWVIYILVSSLQVYHFCDVTLSP